MFSMLFGLICCKQQQPAERMPTTEDKPTISFTFDDGSIDDRPGYSLEVWNAMLLENLHQYNLKAVFFSAGANKTGPKGQYVLSSWNDAGHRIANHTIHHENFNSEKTTLARFEWELLSNDSIINQYSNYIPLFRFPYLKEGNDSAKVNGFRRFMQAKGYKNGHVTIDASDWYIDSRLVKRLQENPKADLEGFKQFYLQHLYDRAVYYEALSYQLTGRHIHHTILLHHNLAAALFLDDLIPYFQAKGWNTIDADKAFADPIYEKVPNTIPAGESLIWALAKQSGKFEGKLRYPAEDGDYEAAAMNALGL